MKKFLGSLFKGSFIALFVAIMFGPAIGAMTFAASFFPSVTGAALMGVQVEIWQKDIVEGLFKNNEFITQSIDESQYVLAGSVVHIPQAGAHAGAQRNRTKLPATITRRKDVDVTYTLDEITTDPRYIPDADKAELSYDKRQSCIAEDMAYIQELVADSMLYNWRPTYYIKTTGSATSAHWGTGNRKAVTLADFTAAKIAFNKWNIPQADRYVVIDTDMVNQLSAELKATPNRDYSVIYDPITGKLKALESFVIYERSTVLLASAPTLTQVTKKNYYGWTSGDKLYTPEQFEAFEDEESNSSPATTACAVALFYSKTCVARALGNTKFFENVGDPTMYGDIYSILQRIGGRNRRGDGKGVIGLIQDAA